MVEPAKRQKVAHNKTRSGCLQCRQRRVKCDEARPSCNRCVKAHLTCPGYEQQPAPRKARKPINRFRIVPFRGAAEGDGSHASSSSPPLGDAGQSVDGGLLPPAPTELDNTFSANQFAFTGDSRSLSFYEQDAIDYFINFTLPVLAKSSPSFELWQQSGVDRLLEEPKIRNMVIAIGLAHRAMSTILSHSSHMLSNVQPDGTAPWDWYYSEALTSLQSDLASSSPAPEPSTALLTCLFFVILASILGRREEGVVHLECGLNIIREHGVAFVAKSRLNQELFLLFLNFGTSSWTFRPNKQLLELLSAPTQWQLRLDFLSRVEQFKARLDALMVAIYRFAAMVTTGRFPSTAAALEAKGPLLRELYDYELALDAYYDQLVAQQSEDADTPQILISVKVMKARTMFALMFVSAVMTRYQTTYDRYLGKFRAVIDLMRSCLLEMYGQGVTPAFAAFSIQTSIIATLWQTTFLCRHPQVRREAAELLSLCPRREGLWDSLEQHKLACKLIEFEERDCVWSEGIMIVPEESRVHMVGWKPPGEADDRDSVHCFVYRPDGDRGYQERMIEIDLSDTRFGPLP